METKKNKLYTTIGVIAISAIVAIVGYFTLPEMVVVQITTSGKGGTSIPKILGLLVPLAISIMYSVRYYKKDVSASKNIIVLVLVLIMYGLMFAFNL